VLTDWAAAALYDAINASKSTTLTVGSNLNPKVLPAPNLLFIVTSIRVTSLSSG
jgi:hypothetical protein